MEKYPQKTFNPEMRMKMATVLLIVSVVGWPVTALTVFSKEPQGILGLSWLAVILTAIDILSTQDVRNTEDEKQ